MALSVSFLCPLEENSYVLPAYSTLDQGLKVAIVATPAGETEDLQIFLVTETAHHFLVLGLKTKVKLFLFIPIKS